MSFSISHKGSFKNLQRFLKTNSRLNIEAQLNSLGQEGVRALQSATPVRTGLTSDSWTYSVDRGRGTTSITWNNTHVNDGVNIAIILQYGHGTGTGGYVEGRDYINPAIQPVFDKIAEKVWKAVESA